MKRRLRGGIRAYARAVRTEKSRERPAQEGKRSAAGPDLEPEIQPYVRAHIYTILYRVQKRLNMIITGVETATCTAWLGAAAGLLLFFRLWPGGAGDARARAPILLRLPAPVLGLLAGWWRGRRKRLSLAATASWLDHSLQLQEIFSAALFCLERGCTGLFDREILTRAGAVARRIKKLHWPLRYLYRRTLPAAAAVLFMVLIPAALDLPFFRQTPPSSRLSLPGTEEEGGFLFQNDEEQAILPEELAGFIFSHDQELAARAADALRTGDMRALAGLLREAGEQTAHSPAWRMAAQELEEFLAGGGEFSPEGEYPGGYPGRQEGIPGSRTGGPPVWGGKPEEDPGSSPEEGWAGRTGEEAAGEGRIRVDKRAGGREADGEFPPAAFAGITGEEGGPQEFKSGGLTGGEGSANGENVGALSERSGQEEAAVTRSADSPVFEYVLPDRDPQTSFAAALPPAARAAEEALAREGVPLEYEEYVRVYFQELAREFE